MSGGLRHACDHRHPPRHPSASLAAAALIAGLAAAVLVVPWGRADAAQIGLEPRVVPDKAELARPAVGRPARRIIVKFQHGSGVASHAGRLRAAAGFDATAVRQTLTGLGILPGSLQRLHSRLRVELDTERLRGEAETGRALADLNLYFVFDVPAGADAGAILARLSALPIVEFAEPEPLPAPPPIDLAPPTADLTRQQGYRSAPPGGIGVFDATIVGGDGANMRAVDIEYSWVLNHEDLELPATANIDPETAWDPFPHDQGNHGTAVLGQLVARTNAYGVAGIAPQTDIRVAPAATYVFGYNVPRAITLATGTLRAGDVILLEQQTSVCGRSSYGPIEWSQAVYDAIASATALGIVVVQAAGNGGVNLDSAGCQNRFNRAVRDSRAIIVGAGSPLTRARLSFSSYGSRLDAQGWGSGVTTTGYGDAFNPGDVRQRYTHAFGGTSSASPIVAGAVLALQGALKGRGLRVATPLEMREALAATGTLQSGTESIGPLPNLPAALPWLVQRISPAIRWQRWESFPGTLGNEAPECIATGAKQTDCWAPDLTGALGWWRYDESGLPAPQRLGGQPASPPSCIRTGDSLHCFAASAGGRLAQIVLTGAAWGTWTDLGGSIRSRPACVSTNGTRIDCLALGTNGKLHIRSRSALAWGAWRTLAPTTTFAGAPTCFVRDGGIDCLAVDAGGRARHLRRNPAGVWEAPTNLAGTVHQAPACVAAGMSGFACFFLGSDGTLREINYSGSAWSPWTTHAGVLASAPSCVRTGAAGLRCFAAATGGTLLEKRQTGGTWGEWRSLGGAIREQRPACVARGSTRIDCFAAGRDGRIAHRARY